MRVAQSARCAAEGGAGESITSTLRNRMQVRRPLELQSIQRGGEVRTGFPKRETPPKADVPLFRPLSPSMLPILEPGMHVIRLCCETIPRRGSGQAAAPKVTF